MPRSIFALSVCAVFLHGSPVNAQTIIIDHGEVIRHPHPMPPQPVPPPIPPTIRGVQLEIERQSLDISITDGAAVTNVEQVFRNVSPHRVEGMYLFPLEAEAAISQFSMRINGQEVQGELLDVNEARRVYESIVSRTQDPALLEYLGTRMFRARIFPIEPRSEAKVKLSYAQVLRTDNGLVRYRHPLGAGRSASGVIGELSVLVRIESGTPIKSVFSTTHNVAVQRSSDHKASASYEGAGEICDRNFDLYYSLANKDFGLTVLTHRLGGEDGFFLARIVPPFNVADDEVVAKDITFVIDTSGSMAGEKIEQARKALTFCLDSLNRKDRFNVISFSHEPVAFRDAPVGASSDNVAEAKKLVGGLRASGGTNINDALQRAIPSMSADNGRPHFVVFITDGLPTVGITDPPEILRNVTRKTADGTRLFAFGVGYDVNSDFLDLLAEQNRGAREYVLPGEDLEIKLSSFYRKVADPVLADVELSFGGLRVYDLYPQKLGDLFAGGELVVAGRYSGDGLKAVELRGIRAGKGAKFVEETNFPSLNKDHDFLPRLWATRKIGFLLDQIRLHGEDKELKDTVIDLATRYGIVTPYTAYLVTEPGSVAEHLRPQAERMARALQDAGDEAFDEVVRAEAPTALRAAPKAGEIAADGAMRQARLRSSGAIQQQQQSKEADVQSYQRSRTFRDRDGRMQVQAPVRHVGRRAFYQVGAQWVESTFNEKKQQTHPVKLYSEEYYELLRQHPDLAECFALGEDVTVVLGEAAYRAAN